MNTPHLTYQITIRGHLDNRWDDWFEDFTLTQTYSDEDEAITELTGTVVDQAALYGMLARLRNLGVSLISVQPLKQEEK
jgi:hypothetical protein